MIQNKVIRENEFMPREKILLLQTVSTLKRLGESEELIGKLESGSVPLEEMVALHERGMALYESCAQELTAFEKRLKAPGADQ